jgi:hypothetical protein
MTARRSAGGVRDMREDRRTSGLGCRIAVIGFAALHAAALALYAIGSFGLFGSPRGPLAGVFLVPLGLPWNLLLDGAPQAALPMVGALTPLVNLGLIAAICRLVHRR